MKFIHGKDQIAGLAVPLLALKKNKNAACGVFSDMRELGKLASSWGLSLIQLLPLNDTGTGTSPYSALSAFALNPIYISLLETPDTMARLGLPLEENAAKGLGRAGHAIDRKFGPAARVAYEEVLSAKMEALRAAWAASNDICAPLAEALAAEEGWAKPYACFVALKDRFGGAPWWKWPEWREAEPGRIDELWFSTEIAEESRFRLWLQVLAREQLRHAAEEVGALDIDIMGDIPILLARDSADVWYRRDIFILDRQAGAPPDMYSPRGQNWGFPLYDWDALRAGKYDFWRERLAYADQFYTSYRIDHVLGFFRIWAIDDHESDAYLGAFDPSECLSLENLRALGFSDERITWLSQPHVPEWKIQDAERTCIAEFDESVRHAQAAQRTQAEGATDRRIVSVAPAPENAAERKTAFVQRIAEFRTTCFERIKSEPLFLFSPQIRGSADIYAAAAKFCADFPEAGESIYKYVRAMADWWIDRALYEAASGEYVFQWTYHDTTSWKSLSTQEQDALATKAAAMNSASLEIWENRGRELLSILISATGMQPFAEDLGAVPTCVPKVLRELEIPGLRVLRWERAWDVPNQPYIPFEDYEPLSVACTSVHDSTNIRQWWEEEADRAQLWAMLKAMADRDAALRSALDGLEAVPSVLSESMAAALVRAMALSSSVVAVYPIQDLLACSADWRESDARAERINIPGTTLDTNWKYRMLVDLPLLAKDKPFSARIAEMCTRGAEE